MDPDQSKPASAFNLGWESLQDGMAGSNDDKTMAADGSVDLRGRPISKLKTGGWKACFYIFGQETAERIAYYGISSNLVTYLTTELREGLATAAKNVNNWNGSVFLFPILGAVVADSFLGRYWTIVIFSLVYTLAALMLTGAVSLRSLRPPPCTASSCKAASRGQVAAFYFALYLMAVGNGGMKPCMSALGADQFDEEDERERKQKLSFFNFWYVAIGTGILFAVTVVVYIQDNVGWGWGYGIPTMALALGMLVFLLGTPNYRHKRPLGTPLLQFFHVFVAAARSRPRPSADLYEHPPQHYHKTGRRQVLHTDTLRFLDRAAAGGSPREEASEKDPWRLCTVTQVEEVKVFLRVVPIWCTSLMFQVVYAQGSTFFVKQAATLDARLGPGFTIPPASFAVFSVLPYLVVTMAYDRVMVRMLRRWTGHPRGVPTVVRMGAGMAFSILAVVAAALTEEKRLRVARRTEPGRELPFLPMSVFWLLPQYVILSLADSFAIIGEMEFFYQEAPDHMKSVGTALTLALPGVGSFLSSALVSITNSASGRHGRPWIRDTLDNSRVDRFYWTLAVLSGINLAAYTYFAATYTSRTTQSAAPAPEAEPAAAVLELAVATP